MNYIGKSNLLQTLNEDDKALAIKIIKDALSTKISIEKDW